MLYIKKKHIMEKQICDQTSLNIFVWETRTFDVGSNV